MNARRVGILLGVAVLIIIGALWMSSLKHGERAMPSGATVLPQLRDSINAVTEVHVIKGDGTRTTLKKGASDWVVDERGFTADSGRVRKLLLDLSELKVLEEKTRDPANYAALGVEDISKTGATGTRIEVVDPKKTTSLIVGKNSGLKSSYVRIVDGPQSLLASPQITVDADAKQWLERTIVDIPQEHVKSVVVTPATGPAYSVQREKKEQTDFTVTGMPKGRELSSPSAANSIAGALASLSLDDVRKPPADVKPDSSAHSVFETFDGLKVDITGRKEGEQHYIAVKTESTAAASESEAQKINARLAGWELQIPAYKYDALFRPLEDSLTPKK